MVFQLLLLSIFVLFITQLELVKKVAKLMGIPYQTYIKQVVYRQSLQDLKDVELIKK